MSGIAGFGNTETERVLLCIGKAKRRTDQTREILLRGTEGIQGSGSGRPRNKTKRKHSTSQAIQRADGVPTLWIEETARRSVPAHSALD